MVSVWVYEHTCPGCRVPDTVGGGVSIEKTSSRALVRSNRKVPSSAQTWRHLASSPSRPGLSGMVRSMRSLTQSRLLTCCNALKAVGGAAAGQAGAPARHVCWAALSARGADGEDCTRRQDTHRRRSDDERSPHPSGSVTALGRRRRGPPRVDLRLVPQRQHVAAADARLARGRGPDRRPAPRAPPRRVAADLARVGHRRAPARPEHARPDQARQGQLLLLRPLPRLVGAGAAPADRRAVRRAGRRHRPGPRPARGGEGAGVARRRPARVAVPRLSPRLPAARRARRRRLVARRLPRRVVGARRGRVPGDGAGARVARALAVGGVGVPHRGRAARLRRPPARPPRDDPLRGPRGRPVRRADPPVRSPPARRPDRPVGGGGRRARVRGGPGRGQGRAQGDPVGLAGRVARQPDRGRARRHAPGHGRPAGRARLPRPPAGHAA